MSTNPNPTPAAGTATTNTPGSAPAPGAESRPEGVVAPAAQGSGAPDAGAGEAVATKPEALKAARLILKEQEATKKLNAERAALQHEREKFAKDSAAAQEALQAEFRKNPMGFAKKYGVSYEDITKAAIAEASAGTPEARIAALEAERQKERTDAETARQAAEQKQQAEQVRKNVETYVDAIHASAAKEAQKYALVNALEPGYAKGLIFDVADLMAIERQKVGNRVLPTAGEVLEQIEAYLDGEADRLSKAKAAKAPKPAAGAAPAAAAGDPGDNADVAALIEAQKKAAARGRPAPKSITNRVAQAPTPAAPNGQGRMTRDEAIKAAIAAGLAAAKGG